jgi:hypothetical protein
VVTLPWNEAFQPLVECILNAERQLTLDGLDRSALNALVKSTGSGTPPQSVGLLAAHLLANGDASQMNWGLDVYFHRDDALPQTEFRARLRDEVRASHAAVFNYLLEKAGKSAKEVGAKSLSGKVDPAAVRLELITSEILQRDSLKPLLLDTLWAGGGDKKSWVLTQDLGEATRQSSLQVDDLLKQHYACFDGVAMWLRGARTQGAALVVLPGQRPETVTRTFESKLKSLDDECQKVRSAVQVKLLAPELPGASRAGDRREAYQALDKYVQAVKEQAELGRKIWGLIEGRIEGPPNLKVADYRKISDLLSEYGPNYREKIPQLRAAIPWFQPAAAKSNATPKRTRVSPFGLGR